MRKITSLVTVCALVLSTSIIYGENKKETLDNKLKENRQEQVSIEQKIEGLNSRINEIESNINETNNKITTLDTEVEKTKEEINQLEIDIEKNEEFLGQRLKVINSNYSLGYLKVILSSTSLSDFFNNIYIVKQVVDQDKEVLKALDKNKSEVEAKEKQLESKKDEQEELKTILENDMTMVQDDKNELEQLKNQLIQEEDSLNSEIEAFLAEEAKKQEEARKQEQANSSSPSGGVISSGSWPVPGITRISSPYGYRIHPILNTKKFHTGIDIPGPVGTPMVAIDNGTIIFSGVKGGYGNTVMVQHDDGKVALYAHASENVVSVGQRVQKGQVVSKMGSTGMSTGSHLHFEIRINGQHVNPVDYI